LSKQEILQIGSRLLGLYFCAMGLVAIPQAFVMWELAASTPGARPWAVVLASASHSALAIAVGLLLILLGRESTQSGSQAGPQLFDEGVFPALVQLLGVYLALHAVGPLIKELSSTVTISASWQFHAAYIGGEVVSLITGLFLVVRTRRVVTWLHKVRGTDA
jgi:hypothetical protein